MKTRPMMLALAVAAAIAAPAAMAEGSTADGIAQYRAMLAEGNPAELWELAGEDIWKEKAGPKQASLEQCDLGKGPGVVKGASAALPRYFKDTDRVQDLESRLMTCMQTLQGISPDNFVKGKWGKGEMEKMEQIVAYVVGQSRDMKINVDMSSPQMKKMYALGKKAFFYRAGPMDFACSTCHGEDGKRIRLQDLPNLTKHEGAAAGGGHGPPIGCPTDSSGPCSTASTTAIGSSASRAHLRLGRYHRVVGLYGKDSERWHGDDPWNQALRRPR